MSETNQQESRESRFNVTRIQSDIVFYFFWVLKAKTQDAFILSKEQSQVKLRTKCSD
jgi:hypothetical protein